MDGIEALLIPTIQSTSTVIMLSEKGNAINLVGVADLSSRQSLTYTTTGEPKTATLPTPPIRKFPFPAGGTGHKINRQLLFPATVDSQQCLIDQILCNLAASDVFSKSPSRR